MIDLINQGESVVDLPAGDQPDDTSPLPDDLVVPDDLSALLDGDIGTEADPGKREHDDYPSG